ncbi:MAG TPA: MoxR family ATPase [Thermoplasmata archaeon]|nr:MoxR family ATPase [Thermoplasmata archaeon]
MTAPTASGAIAPAVTGPTAVPTEEAASPLARLQAAIGDNVIGHSGAVEALTIALAADGHVLLEGVPGLAKTYLVRSFAHALDLTFHRIQFTPDMLPSDIVGNVVLSARTHEFEFRPGPIFANVVLADEINRAPPKVQSALLEAMQEFQVTVDGRSYPLARPFLVIATQNSIELGGTYPLPEAQLDRFLFRYLLGYPNRADEVEILRRQTAAPGREPPAHVLSVEDIAGLRSRLAATHVAPDLFEYTADLVRETRTDPRILIGASPRAGVHLLLAARARAAAEGRTYVLPDDLRALAFPVFNHRIVLRPEVRRPPGKDVGTPRETDILREAIGGAVDRVKVPR